MHILAGGGSTQTEWVIVDGTTILEQAYTTGINPYYMSRREISHIIRLELPDAFFRHRWHKVYFYGPGCNNEKKIKMVESSLVAQFKSPAQAMSNLLGAAHGLLLHRPGLVAILSTGANSCYYDGEGISQHVRSGGFILGDEGSSSAMGKNLVSDILKQIAPSYIIDRFYGRFATNADEVMDLVYSRAQPSHVLAGYSQFLAENIDEPYCRELVYDAFMAFFRRNIGQYDYQRLPVAFVGNTAVTYPELLHQAAADFGASISKIEASCLPGLIKYYGG